MQDTTTHMDSEEGTNESGRFKTQIIRISCFTSDQVEILCSFRKSRQDTLVFGLTSIRGSRSDLLELLEVARADHEQELRERIQSTISKSVDQSQYANIVSFGLRRQLIALKNAARKLEARLT